YVNTGLLTAIQVRRPIATLTTNPAMTTHLTIELSTSPNPHTAASTTFAANHGADSTRVFHGLISLPAEAPPTFWPAPWQAPFVFSTPFAFTRQPNRAFVVD